MQADLVGVSLATSAGRAAYVPLGHKAEAGEGLFGGDALADGQIDIETALALLRPVLSDPAILKIGQNLKIRHQGAGPL
jgi:DNA polymerase-1